MTDKERYKDVTAIVEVTSYESLCLWQYWHQKKGYTWIESNHGPIITVGSIENRPVCIAPMIHVVNGRHIMFLEATSILVDWKMIEDWLFDNVVNARNGTTVNKVDAQNFHCIVH